MYLKENDLIKQYKNGSLSPMDIGITLSLISMRDSSFNIDNEIELIDEVLTKLNKDKTFKEKFIEEIYDYFSK